MLRLQRPPLHPGFALLTLYRGATQLGAPLIGAALKRRASRAKEDPARLPERLGQASAARPAGPLLWLHGASVGESPAVLPLLAALLASRPALQVLITTGTVTSARLLGERLPARARHQFAPVDQPAAWRSFLAHWRPQLAVLVEPELWPNLILETHRRGVPIALINARMSARSHRRWSRVPGVTARLLAPFDLCLAQSPVDRDRLVSLGARQVHALGNLKVSAPALPVDTAALARLAQVIGRRPVWLAASIHADEEEAIVAAHRHLAARLPGLLTIIAPRHPERGQALLERARQGGLASAQRSKCQSPDPDCALYLADTLGELGLFYRLAGVAFVGKSLVPHGGQNPLEPARLGCPVVFGCHMDNFEDMAADLVRAGAARRVADAGELAAVVAALLRDPGARTRMAERARGAAAAQTDVLGATLDVLDRTLGPADASA